MTPEQRARMFGGLVKLLDSDQAGERAAALDKLITLRPKMQWPSFTELLRKLENTITSEQLEAAERRAAQAVKAHEAQLAENARLARLNSVQAAALASLRSALWFATVKWRRVGLVGLVCVPPVYLTWSAVNSAGGSAPGVSKAAAAESTQTAIDTGMRDVLSRMKWGLGDTPPVVITVTGTPYWVVVRGSVNASSHTDAQGRPIERHCLELYANEAVRDAGAYLTPAPYRFGMWMKWPRRADECRMPGSRNYS